MDITAIGEVLIDLTQTGVNEYKVPTFAANPGGAPANVAVSAARLGASAAFLGKVGRDGFGAYLTGVLQENGVDVSGLCTGEAATTMAIVSVDKTGERDFRFVRGADCELREEEVDLELIRGLPFPPLWLCEPHGGCRPADNLVCRPEGPGDGGAGELRPQLPSGAVEQ